MHLVLGLGNPGRKYEATRHNVGFLVADRLAERWHGACDRSQYNAHLGSLRVHDAQVVVAKPQTYMNRSGQAATSLRGYYKVPDEQVVVVHDDVDIPCGQVRVKKGGGHGGHNGLRDLKQRLGTGDFLRVRVGVSRPPPRWDTADYVLAPWSREEQDHLPEVVDRAVDAVEGLIRDGWETTVNTFNQRARARRASDGAGAERDGASAPALGPDNENP